MTRSDPQSRYICQICGKWIESIPLYIHVLVWHRILEDGHYGSQ